MIEQKRFIDDNEGIKVEQFFQDVIERYELRKLFASIELRYRGVNYGLYSANHITDDKIVQLVVENKLVAMAFLRRDDFNYTEVSFVVLEDAIQKCKDLLKQPSRFNP